MLEFITAALTILSSVFLGTYFSHLATEWQNKKKKLELTQKLYGILKSALINLQAQTREADHEQSAETCPSHTYEIGAIDYFRKEIPPETVEPEIIDKLNTLIFGVNSINRLTESMGNMFAARGPKNPHYTDLRILLGNKKTELGNLANEISSTISSK